MKQSFIADINKMKSEELTKAILESFPSQEAIEKKIDIIDKERETAISSLHKILDEIVEDKQLNAIENSALKVIKKSCKDIALSQVLQYMNGDISEQVAVRDWIFSYFIQMKISLILYEEKEQNYGKEKRDNLGGSIKKIVNDVIRNHDIVNFETETKILEECSEKLNKFLQQPSAI